MSFCNELEKYEYEDKDKHKDDEKNNKKESEKIILKNEYFYFSREKKNNYLTNCKIENNNIHITDLFNFNLLQLMYQLNSDIFQTIEFTIINENEANLYLLIKPLLQNLGIWQRFVSLKFTKTVLQDESVIFTGIPDIEYANLKHNCKNAVIAPLSKIIFHCSPSTPNKFNLTTYFTLEDNFVFPLMLEKFIGIIFKKVYKNIIKGVKNINNKK
jgi:hypothetical protein